MSIKACLPEEHKDADVLAAETKETKGEKKPKRAKSVKTESEETGSQWNEDIVNNPFADLLKDLGEESK